MPSLPSSAAALSMAALLLAGCSGGGGAAESAGDGHDHEHGEVVGSFALAANAGGFLLLPDRNDFEPGRRDVSFRIIGRDGATQTGFDISHEERMHLLLVSHDMERYVHLHPQMSEDGTWSVPAELSHEGGWRMVADFVPTDGENTLLGADLTVGDAASADLPRPESDVRVSRNGTVEAVLEGETAHERDMPLRIVLTEDGAPLAADRLTRWMGADAHMVAFMTHPDEPELQGMDARNAFIHMHPNGDLQNGQLTFTAPPTPHGWWQIFVDTIIDGQPTVFRFKVYAP